LIMRNLLKDKLQQKKVTLGVTLGIGNSETSEALANLGLDWLGIDTQHTSVDEQTLKTMMQAMSYSEATPIVRVVSNDLGLINKALDLGAHAVIVPLVNSRQDAERAVLAARYAPDGMRSWGPRRPALRDPDYANTANIEVMIVPQIETELALKNIDDIVTTDGVDAIFIGPYDLSMSLGVFRQFDSEKYLKAIEKIVSSCEEHDVAPGLLAPTGPIETMVQQRFKLISLGGDLNLLTQTVVASVKAARDIVIKIERH